MKSVKSMWPIRIGRSRSLGNHHVNGQEGGPSKRLENIERPHFIVEKSVTPQTPTTDTELHWTLNEHEAELDDMNPLKSPTSSASITVSNSSSMDSMAPTLPITVNTCHSASSQYVDSPRMFSFPPPMSMPWRALRSVSDATSSSSSSSLFASVNLMTTFYPREAAENATNNIHNMCTRPRHGVPRYTTCGSPYGELIVVDILEARDLAIESTSAPLFGVTMQLGSMSRKSNSTARSSSIVNERFVFWVPSTPLIDRRTLDIFVHSGDERDLGEVHFSLAMPVNETFGDWFPLVCRADGLKHGTLKVAMRRLVLTSLPMVKAAKTLDEQTSCLSLRDCKAYGALLPELQSTFPRSELETSSFTKEQNISSKIVRLIGFQDVQRTVF